jgi:tetratricopeptide (TPR) repeat protein
MRRDWFWILAACLLVYANSLDNGFHYDDEHSIQKNIHIRDLENFTRFFTDPSTFSVDHDKGMFRPLLLISYALNYAYGEYEVTSFHVVNLALHTAIACLLWALIVSLGAGRQTALVAGLLFALHPLGSEPVNYISSRSESLAALFYVGALWCFVAGGAHEVNRYRVASWFCLFAGLLSKSSAITLPAVLLLYDFVFLSDFNGKKLLRYFTRRHLGYWLIALAYLATITANSFLTNSLSRRVRGMDEQLLTQSKAFAYYAKLLIWPHGLNVEHQFSVSSSVEVAVAVALMLFFSCAVLLFWSFRRRWRGTFFLIMWALISLAPVVIMPLNVLVNERRLYLPTVAFCAGLALVLHSRFLRRYATALSAVLLVLYAGLTWQRNGVWQDNFSLWGDAVAKAPQMPRVQLYMGNTHKDAAMALPPESPVTAAHWEQARSYFRRAIELESGGGDLALRALNNLGAVSFVLRDIDAAEKAYRRAVELNPDYADALVNLGTIYHERGRVEQDSALSQAILTEAVEFYRRALKFLPNHADAWANMGLAYFDLSNFTRAKQSYDKAYYLNPNNPRLLNNYGNYYATLAQRAQGESQRQHLDRARKYYQQALRLNPAYPAPNRGLQFIEQMLQQGAKQAP